MVDVADEESYFTDLAAALEAEAPSGPAAIDSNIALKDTSTTPAPKIESTTGPSAVPTQTPPKPAEDTADNAAAIETPPKTLKQGWLSINARPSAEIYVDGVYKGDTPPSMSFKLTSGEHKVECKHPRYETYSEVMKITTGELSRRNVTLKKLKGIISLATQEGAELYVDGVLVGVTPMLKPVEVDVGPHVLTIKKEGFYVWSSEVNVEPKKVLPLRITLSPRY